MEQDFVRALGLPFLAHRLKRASELILEGSTAALRRHGFDSPARSGSTLLLLDALGAMGVTEIAYRLGLSHPLIIKLAAAMAAAGLVRDESDPKDHRRRLIALTDKGRAEAGRMAQFSAALAGVFSDMFAEAGADLFAALERFEAAAAARPLATRIEAALAESEFSE
jgi:DNA-binding MarR family transcriptional regulator